MFDKSTLLQLFYMFPFCAFPQDVFSFCPSGSSTLHLFNVTYLFLSVSEQIYISILNFNTIVKIKHSGWFSPQGQIRSIGV